MVSCEMCSGPNAIFQVEVEGSRLTVCEKCSKYGKVVGKAAVPMPKAASKGVLVAAPAKKTETVQVIRSDYARIIKLARERLGLTQEDFAKKLMERASTLHKIESGHLKPDLALARKLEKVLKISLVEQVELESSSQPGERKKGDGMTLGDLIKL